VTNVAPGFHRRGYPAEYRAAGMMTFMINQDGVIVQKNLGVGTDSGVISFLLAKSVTNVAKPSVVPSFETVRS
jgi:hypothetical protein